MLLLLDCLIICLVLYDIDSALIRDCLTAYVRSCLLHPSGLHIIYTQDEVDVVQNLMFYIEAAYKVAVSIHSLSTSRTAVMNCIFWITAQKETWI